jgi:hypothetical protein
MRRIAFVVAVVCLIALVPSSARAASNSYNFPVCGTVVNRNMSHQFGTSNWLEYIVETQGVFDICGQWVVTAAADVSGVSNSAITVDGILYAVARRQVPVPNWGTFQTNGHHWAATVVPFLRLHTGETVTYADIRPLAGRDRQQQCAEMGGTWNGVSCSLPNCPLIIDTAGDGYRLTSVEEGVRFDLDADGFPELVAWTRTGSDDAWLALDRNNNGKIDDGSELFGNHSPIYPASPEVTTANGFEVLKFMDSLASGVTRVPDGRVDARDPIFSKLLLWRDLNHNGVSEPGELTRVIDERIVAIGTDYKSSRRTDRFGNEFRQVGRLQWSDGEVAKVVDVWLQARN